MKYNLRVYNPEFELVLESTADDYLYIINILAEMRLADDWPSDITDSWLEYEFKKIHRLSQRMWRHLEVRFFS